MAEALPPVARELLLQARERRTVHAGACTVWHVWGAGKPVVLLHGGSGSWTHWIRNIDALVAAGREVWVPDMPGFGDSDKPPGARDADALVAPLVSGLQQLLDAREFDLVGFSFGGLVGALMAPSAPALRRLVIVGAPLLGVGIRPVRLREWRHLDADAAIEVHRSNLLALMLHHPQAVTPLALALHQAHIPLDRLRRRSMARTDLLARTLATVSCPLFAIYGAHDVLYRDQLAQVEATLDALPTLRWHSAIADAGHWVQFEAPEAFDRALARALA
jgi:pimeloyl-ACP methyl ester carboxylesterase